MRRGISLAMNTIVIAVLVLLVLMVVAVFFTGAGRDLLGKISTFGRTVSEQANETILGDISEWAKW